MVPQTSFRRSQRQVMLNPVSAENLNAAVITSNRQSNRHRSFGEFKPPSFRFGDLQMVRDEIKLLASHPKSGMVVNFHN